MNYVKFDDIVHHVLAGERKLAIHSRGRAFQKRPCFRLVFGELRVRVVQVGDHDDPVVDPHPGDDVEENDHAGADLGPGVP